MPTITPFLMFKGNATEAISLYRDAFVDCKVVSLERYAAGGQGVEGTVKRASLRIFGRDFTVIDSAVDHEFGFTPAVSFFVECGSSSVLERCYKLLIADGEILMPSSDYGFSKKFAWVTDKFGVSWQLNVAA